MSLAEQVVEQLKTDMDNVYDAGYQKGLKDVGGLDVSKFGIQNEVTGTNIVTCDYVNENEHNVEVKLSSEGVTDFSDKVVRVCGKNLVDINKLLDINNYIPMEIQPTNSKIWIDAPIGVVTISWATPLIAFPLTLKAYDSNETLINDLVVSGSTTSGQRSINIIENGFYLRIDKKSVTQINDFLIEFQCESSHVKTDYEPYTEQIYTTNADGTVDGVTSISPVMSLICNTEGVDITARYYCVQDVEWHRFWDEYQEYGQRTHYSRAFFYAYWNDKNYNPKYKMTPTNAEYMFNQCNITDIKNMVDFSAVTSLSNVFSYSAIKKIVMDIPNVKSAVAAFRACTLLKEITLLNVNSTCTFDNAFTSNAALSHVEITGTIGQSINFQWSPLLSDASVQDIIDCLADLTGQTTQTLTFHADVKAKLTEEQIATITSKNWTLA